MSIDALKKIYHAEPFQPFAFRMNDGRRVEVPHPEHMWIPPAGRMIYVYEGPDIITWIDLPLVESIEIGKRSA